MERKRPPIPKVTETEVLIRSRRRCCLCVFLKGDLVVKQIQIAHLDRDRENNNPDNLVALCLEHHDEYDSRRSQSKGIKIDEVKHYRGELDKIIQKQDEQLSLPAIGSNTIATPSARLLGQVLFAFDNEMQRLQAHLYPNGIALANLGRIAIEEEGDFDVAIEVFISLIRLSTTAMRDNKIFAIHYSGSPTATPALGAVESLHRMQKKDFGLFVNAIHRTRVHALVGDSPFSSLSDYTKVPDKSFEVITSVLYACRLNTNYRFSDWAAQIMAEQLFDLLLGIAFVIVQRGIELLEPPSKIWIDLQAERCVGEDESEDLLPFVRLANKIASLPKALFDRVLTRPNYRVGIRDVIVDIDKGYEQTEAIETIRRWAVVPFYAITPPMQVKSEDVKKECLDLIHQVNEIGSKVGDRIREYLLSERKIILKGQLR